MTCSRPFVSVVVPTFNRRNRLSRTLQGLSEQSLDRDSFETIVVSDGSTDGTMEYLASGAVPLPVRAFSQENAGPGAARNRGIEAAKGELIVFVDDDIVPDHNLLSSHVAAHRNHDGPLVTIGPMLTPIDIELSPWIEWEQRMLYKQYDAMREGRMAASARQFYTGNAATRREHLIAAGGFDESLRRAEDVELAYRLDRVGTDFAFVDDAVGYHYAERPFDSWRSNAYEYGRNDILFARQFEQSWMEELIAYQFRSRHRLVRAIVKPVVYRPNVHRALDVALRRVSRLSGRIGLGGLEQAILSVVYNLAYYEGVHDECGDLARVLDVAH